MAILLDPNPTTVAIVAYPLREDGLLNSVPRNGFVETPHDGDLELRLTGGEPLQSRALLVGIQQRGRATAYMGVEIDSDFAEHGERLVTAMRGGVGERVLAEAGRLPVLNPRQFRYELAFEGQIYRSWQQVGILRPVVLDKVLVCPKCSSLPTFRWACHRCGSGRLTQSVMAHHFACACVAPIADFQRKQSLQCPKCQTQHLIAGTDFEYAPGEYLCQDCGWKSRELAQLGHCLQCHSRFPWHQAAEYVIEGYDVDRVDTLAFIPHVE